MTKYSLLRYLSLSKHLFMIFAVLVHTHKCSLNMWIFPSLLSSVLDTGIKLIVLKRLSHTIEKLWMLNFSSGSSFLFFFPAMIIIFWVANEFCTNRNLGRKLKATCCLPNVDCPEMKRHQRRILQYVHNICPAADFL